MDVDQKPNLSSPSEQVMQACSSPVFPISRVPADVLLLIFHLGTLDFDRRLDTGTFPLLVSHVCYQWRELALQSSMLWTRISVRDVSPTFTLPSPPVVDDLAPQRAFPRAAVFLERSRSCPIKVDIDFRSKDYDYNVSDYESQFNSPFTPFFSQLLSILLEPHAARFKEFCFLSDIFLPIIDVLSRLCETPMPQLEVWEVQRCNVYHCFQPAFEPRGTKNALTLFSCPESMQGQADAHSAALYPNLKHVVISGAPLQWSRFTLRNLKSLTLNFFANEARPTFEKLRCILLANEHSLQTLQIQGAAPLDIGTPYVLSNVRMLTLGYTRPDEALRLVCTIRTPNVVGLVVTDLARYLTDPSERPHTHLDQCAMVLFAAIMRYMPVDKINYLVLRSVIFYPPNMGCTSAKDLAIGGKLPPLLSFLRCLSSLGSLIIDEPDNALMHFLNCPILSSSDDNGGRQPSVFALPTLTDLSLGRMSFPDVRRFFSARADFARLPNQYTLPSIPEVTLCVDMEDGDIEWLHKTCKDSDIVGRLLTDSPVTDDDDSDMEEDGGVDGEAMDMDADAEHL